MTGTQQRATAAAQGAQSSADSPALAVTQACARQPAETALSLSARHVTTATLLVVDAVISALSNLDGDAQHHQHAVYRRSAILFVETGLSMEVNNATVVLGAAKHARPSADTPALAVHVRQPAETAWSLATSNATTTTIMVRMDAVRAAL